MMNGMDRVMHLSFVTTAPRHEGGQGIAMEISCFFTFKLLLVWGENKVFVVYRQKGSVRKLYQTAGETSVVLPTGCPPQCRVFSRYNNVFAGEKVKDPSIPRGWGLWLQMTGA